MGLLSIFRIKFAITQRFSQQFNQPPRGFCVFGRRTIPYDMVWGGQTTLPDINIYEVSSTAVSMTYSGLRCRKLAIMHVRAFPVPMCRGGAIYSQKVFHSPSSRLSWHLVYPAVKGFFCNYWIVSQFSNYYWKHIYLIDWMCKL